MVLGFAAKVAAASARCNSRPRRVVRQPPDSSAARRETGLILAMHVGAKIALSLLRGEFFEATLKSLRACCDRALGDFTLQNLVRRAIGAPPRMRASARASLSQSCALACVRCHFHASDARARVHDAPVHNSNRQNLVRRVPARLSRMRASARVHPRRSCLSLR